jgi:hypothetical protein
MRLKFEDCRDCRHRRRPAICRDCDYGELFEDRERMTVDELFKQTTARFGDSVIHDDDTQDDDLPQDENDDE